MTLNDFNFENAIKQLENIADLLENENTTIDESIELFEKGIHLSKECSDYLENTKQKIVSLTDYEEDCNDD